MVVLYLRSYAQPLDSFPLVTQIIFNPFTIFFREIHFSFVIRDQMLDLTVFAEGNHHAIVVGNFRYLDDDQ